MLSFVAIDFETANNSRDSACAIGVVKVVDGEIAATDQRLINPQTNFLRFFTDSIHGISAADVADAPLFDEVWTELAPLLEGADFFAAHNAPFDRSVLTSCCDRYGLRPPGQRFVCSCQVAKAHWGFKPATLNAVCERLGIELDHHQALSDATACAKILLAAAGEGYSMA